MRISFLAHHAYGLSGVVRTTCNLANALAEHHDVEVVSVFRHRDEPLFAYDPRVRLRPLVDLRKTHNSYEGDAPDARRPSAIFPRSDGGHRQYTALTDARIGQHLASLDADVVIGTRPGLNVHIARQTAPGVIRVGQEHETFDNHRPLLNLTLRRHYRRLHAIATTSRADAETYRRKMWLPGVRLVAVPNCVPAPVTVPADGAARVVMAAGRLAPVKQYDHLIRAFALVVAERPDWKLRIYGDGEMHARLSALIDALGLRAHVRLMGQVVPIDVEMAKASVLAVSSRMESFGMTIVEGMRAGLPVVSVDCPHGPREIISHGVDGLLVPPGDTQALAAALLSLANDQARRQLMGRAALARGRAFDPGPIARQWTALFEELRAERTAARRNGYTMPPAAVLAQTAVSAAGDVARASSGAALRLLGALAALPGRRARQRKREKTRPRERRLSGHQ